jgi:FG-GAP-like repeat
MGVAVGDYDCDGWFDIFKTNFADDTCNLYHNNGDGTFTDVTFASGVGINNRYVAWGCGLVDVDNDGWPDIMQINGPVYPEIDGHGLGQTFKNPRLVYKNLGDGRFKDVSADMGPGISERFSSRGAAFGDYDNDGDIDALVLNLNDVPSLLRNDGGTHRIGPRSNCSGRSAIAQQSAHACAPAIMYRWTRSTAERASCRRAICSCTLVWEKSRPWISLKSSGRPHRRSKSPRR